MLLYLLDTDHLSLIERDHPQITARFNQTERDLMAASVISFEEQMRGWLAEVRYAQTKANVEQMLVAYERLCRAQEAYCGLRLLPFTATDFALYEQLRKKHRHVGKMDLRIAATALTRDLTLVTRNTKDFIDIENLRLENWA